MDDATLLRVYDRTVLKILKTISQEVPHLEATVTRFRIDCAGLTISQAGRFDWKRIYREQIAIDDSHVGKLSEQQICSSQLEAALGDLETLLSMDLVNFVYQYVRPILDHSQVSIQSAAARVCGRASHFQFSGSLAECLDEAIVKTSDHARPMFDGLVLVPLRHLAHPKYVRRIAQFFNYSDPTVQRKAIQLVSHLTLHTPDPAFASLRKHVVATLERLSPPSSSTDTAKLLSTLSDLLQLCPEICNLHSEAVIERLCALSLNGTQAFAIRAMDCLAVACQACLSQASKHEWLIFQVIQHALDIQTTAMKTAALHLLSSYASHSGTASQVYRSHSWVLKSLVSLIGHEDPLVQTAATAALGFVGAIDPLSSPVVSQGPSLYLKG